MCPRFLLLGIPGPQLRLERHALVVGEAMAMQKPGDAPKVGGVRERLHDAGIIVAGKDLDALAGACFAVMRISKEQRRELAELRASAFSRTLTSTHRPSKSRRFIQACRVFAAREPRINA